MKTPCLRLKLVELNFLQVSLLTIRAFSIYLTHPSHQDETFQKKMCLFAIAANSLAFPDKNLWF